MVEPRDCLVVKVNDYVLSNQPASVSQYGAACDF